MKLHSLVVALVVIGAFAHAPAVSAQQLSRAQAVAQALAVNPAVKLSLEQVALLEGRITEARADALPDVSWTTRALRSRDPGLLNSPNFDQFPNEFRTALAPIPGNSFDTYADVTQTLFSFKLGHALSAAKLARTGGDEDVRRARQGTALLAIQSYNQLLFAIEQLQVARSTIDQKQGHVDVARNRRAAGAATELEVLRAEVDLENQRAELLRAETLVAASRARLNTVMFRPTGTPIEPTDALAISEVATTLDEAVTEALVARPELQSLRIEMQVRDRLIEVVRADMKPSVEFVGGYGLSVRNPRNFFDVSFTRWAAGVTLTVPLFDGHRTGRPRRSGPGRSEHRDAAHRLARERHPARRAVGLGRVDAGQPHAPRR